MAQQVSILYMTQPTLNIQRDSARKHTAALRIVALHYIYLADKFIQSDLQQVHSTMFMSVLVAVAASICWCSCFLVKCSKIVVNCCPK